MRVLPPRRRKSIITLREIISPGGKKLLFKRSIFSPGKVSVLQEEENFSLKVKIPIKV